MNFTSSSSRPGSEAEPAAASFPNVTNTDDLEEWLSDNVFSAGEGAAKAKEKGKGTKGARPKNKPTKKPASEPDPMRDDEDESETERVRNLRSFSLGKITRVRYLVNYSSGVKRLLNEDPTRATGL